MADETHDRAHVDRGTAAEPAPQRAAAQVVGARRPADLGQGTDANGAAAAATAAGAVTDSAPGAFSVLPAFDDHHPPRLDLIDDCVHCGFCLPTCPTYVLFGEEMDSPRGRIYLMRTGLEGDPLTESMTRHFDLCLGCMACVTACPSGVQYDALIEATRQQVERRAPRSRGDRLFRELVFSLFPHPRRLRVAAAPLRPYQRLGVARALHRSGLMGRLPRRLQAMERLMPSARTRERVPLVTPPVGMRKRRVGLLTGCVQRVFFSGVNAATARVLAADGCEVVAPRRQGCCGALSLHAGREAEAQALARRTIDVFEAAGVETVAVNAAGCGSAMKEYGALLRDDPDYAERARAFSERVRDVCELLDEIGPEADRHPLSTTVAYHDACHLAHAQGVRSQPRAALRAVPGLELREIREGEVCCGSAGIYNLVETETAERLGERKAANVLATGAEVLVTSNPGCLLQLRSALASADRPIAMAHPMEVLDLSIRGAPVEELLARRV